MPETDMRGILRAYTGNPWGNFVPGYQYELVLEYTALSLLVLVFSAAGYPGY